MHTTLRHLRAGALPRPRHPLRKVGPTAVLALLLVALGAGVAAANEEGESSQSSALVQQAQALLVNGNTADAVAEKLRDALRAPDPAGTDLAVVRVVSAQVEQLPLTEGRRTQLAGRLQRALLPSGPVAMARGAEPGTQVVLPELKPARGISDGGDLVLAVLAVAAVAGGTALTYRWRPVAAPVHPAGADDE